MELLPNARLDIPLGHQFGERVGTFSITPLSSGKYHAFLSRYNQSTNGEFNFAFTLQLKESICDQILPISTMNRTTGWLHLGNIGSSSSPIEIFIKNSKGELLTSKQLELQPKSTSDLYINNLLDLNNQYNGATGTIQVICKDDNIRGFIGNYGNTDGAGANWAYATQPQSNSNLNFYPTNTFLNSANWLLTTNQSLSSNKMETASFNQLGNPLIEHANELSSGLTWHFGAHEQLGYDRVGLISTNSPSRNHVYLLRIYGGLKGEIQNILPLEGVSLNDLQVSSTFPKDRSLERRRIGLTRQSWEKLQQINSRPPTSPEISKKLLKLLQYYKEPFQKKSSNLGIDFTSVGGYTWCSKAITSLGILGILGDTQALTTAKEILLAAVSPLNQIRPKLSDANAILTNNELDDAIRIIALNVLHESGVTDKFITRGNNIYLETGERSTCIGIGYDWLYPYLNNEEKRLTENALKEILLWSANINESFFSNNSNPAQKHSNWNPIMNGGSGIASIAALNEGTSLNCNEILARKNNAYTRSVGTLNSLAELQFCNSAKGIEGYWEGFTNAGICTEGPTYWSYGMESYTLFTDTAFQIIKYSDLSKFNNIKEKSALAQNILLFKDSPFWTGRPNSVWEDRRDFLVNSEFFNYSDSSPGSPPSSYPFLSIGTSNLKLANLGRKVLARQIENDSEVALWPNYPSDWTRIFSLFLDIDPETNELSTDTLTAITTPDHKLDFSQISAKSNNGLWVTSVKGGKATENHSHLDSSSISLRIGQTTWFSDLGLEWRIGDGYPKNYFTLPLKPEYATPQYLLGLSYFRKNDLSHNLVSLAGKPFNIDKSAKLISWRHGINSPDNSPFREVKWDTSELYSPEVISSERMLRLFERGSDTTLNIYDKLNFNSPPEDRSKAIANWHITHCPPAISNARSQAQILKIAGRSTVKLEITIPNKPSQYLNLTAYEPTGANFEITPANPNTNLSIRKTAPNVVENENTDCLLISLAGRGRDLIETSLGHTLNFTIRAEQ